MKIKKILVFCIAIILLEIGTNIVYAEDDDEYNFDFSNIQTPPATPPPVQPTTEENLGDNAKETIATAVASDETDNIEGKTLDNTISTSLPVEETPVLEGEVQDINLNAQNTRVSKPIISTIGQSIVPTLRANLESRNYIYFQYNIYYNLYSQFMAVDYNWNKDKNDWNIINSKGSFPLLYINQNYLLGYYLIDIRATFEIEYTNFTLYMDKINDTVVTNSKFGDAYINTEHVMINFKQDLFSITKKQDLITFYKIGVGFGQVVRAVHSPSSHLDARLQVGLGVYYRLTNVLDLEVGYKVLASLYQKRVITKGAQEYKIQLIESLLYTGIRFKVNAF